MSFLGLDAGRLLLAVPAAYLTSTVLKVLDYIESPSSSAGQVLLGIVLGGLICYGSQVRYDLGVRLVGG